jgi:hypothetical protein
MKNYGTMKPIIVGSKRVVPYDQVLGIWEMPVFELKAGDILEILDEDVYRRYFVRLHGQEFWMWAKLIDQCSNPVKEK